MRTGAPCGPLATAPTRVSATRKPRTRVSASDVVTFDEVTRPSRTDDGLSAPGLRFGDPRVMALFTVLVGFGPLIAGFTNEDLRERLAALLGVSYSARRRLRPASAQTQGPHRAPPRSASLPGHAVRPPGGRPLVKTYGRVLTPGLSSLDPGVGADVASPDPRYGLATVRPGVG